MNPRRAFLSLALALALALSGTACTQDPADEPNPTPSDTSPAPSPSPAPSAPPAPEADPTIRRLPDAQWDAMVNAGVWREGCPLSREELRRVEVNHWDFDGGVRRGVLVVNADVAESIARIFTRLFEERFPVRRMEPVEVYGGDSDASLRADNTSAYNCRRPGQINAPVLLSPHANGRAIDINPRENPWRDPRCDCWSPSARHHERTEGEGVILRHGPVWEAFTDEGWIWQNIDVPDYMHFDTGYPSEPFVPPRSDAP